ncbi:MAG: hypothetical protein ABI461_12145 [Polyangiaceae bacterium]
MRGSAGASAITFAFALSFAGSSYAQSASSDAAAQQFFDEGRTLMAAQHYAEACQKFDASDRLSPAGGTLLNLADCYEKAGKTASAWAKYNEAADRANAVHKADAEKFARDHAKALAGKLSYLKLVVSAGASATSGLVIQIDGAAIDRHAWSAPLPVDPGAHKVDATAPGKTARDVSADVAGEGTTATATIDDLENDPNAVVPPPKVGDEPPPSNGDPSKGSTQRVFGLGIAAAGVVGLGVGTVFGFTAKTKHDRVTAGCSGGTCTDASLVGTNDDATHAATISTFAFIAGGAFLVGGVVLYLTAPKADHGTAIRITPQVGAGSGRLLLEGTF